MKCHEKTCNGEIYFTQSFEKEKRKHHRILNYFCPICGWIKQFKIEISKKQFKKEEDKEPIIFKL